MEWEMHHVPQTFRKRSFFAAWGLFFSPAHQKAQELYEEAHRGGHRAVYVGPVSIDIYIYTCVHLRPSASSGNG